MVIGYCLAFLFLMLGFCFAFGWKVNDIFGFIGVAFLGWEHSVAAKASLKYDSKLKVLSAQQRKSSIAYKYFEKANDVIVDLGWKAIGVTVEGLTALLIIAGFVVFVVLSLAIKNLIIGLLCGVMTIVVILVMMNSIAILGHRRARIIRTHAINALCGSMRNKIDSAIEENRRYIDPSIWPFFEKFLTLRKETSISLSQALYWLNLDLGSQADRFCDAVLIYMEHYKEGCEDLFVGIITDNTAMELSDTNNNIVFNRAIKDYVTCVGIIVTLMVMIALMYSGMQHFLLTPIGVLCVLVLIAILLAGYIILQHLNSDDVEV